MPWTFGMICEACPAGVDCGVDDRDNDLVFATHAEAEAYVENEDYPSVWRAYFVERPA